MAKESNEAPKLVPMESANDLEMAEHLLHEANEQSDPELCKKLLIRAMYRIITVLKAKQISIPEKPPA